MERKRKIINIKFPKNKIFFLLVAGIVTMMGLYMYFMNSMVADIVDGRQKSFQIQKLALEEQQLEKNYFDTFKRLDLEYAHSLGLIAQKQNDVVVRQTSMARR